MVSIPNGENRLFLMNCSNEQQITSKITWKYYDSTFLEDTTSFITLHNIIMTSQIPIATVSKGLITNIWTLKIHTEKWIYKK